MKILSNHEELSPASAAGRSFFHYTTNNDNGFQQYLQLEIFEKQLSTGKSKGLVVYEHPAHTVASAIMNGNYNNAPLQEWIDEAKNSLTVIRRYRRNMLVVERDATDEQFFRSAFTAAFAGRQPPQEIAPRSRDTETLKLLIALFAVRQSRPVAQLLGELEASSIAATNELPLDDALRVAAKEMQKLLDRAQASKAELQKLEEDNRQLEEDNRQLEEDNRQLEEDNRQLEEDNRQLEEDNRRIALEIEATKQSTKSRDAEANEILIRQVLDLESSIKQLDLSHRKAEERAEEFERKHQTAAKEVADLKATINLIRRSTSWRLTAPVRAIKNPFSR